MSIAPTGGAPEFKGEAKASRLEVSYAVYNRKTRKWETPALDSVEVKQIQKAVENIKWIGQKDESGAFKHFDSEGMVIEITGNQILVKRGDRWVDLLKEKGVSKETRRTLRQITSAVTSTLGGVSETKGKAEVAIDKKTLGSLRGKNPVIQVKVTSMVERFVERYSEEFAFCKQVEETHINFDSWVKDLEEQGFDFRDIDLDEAKTKLTALYETSGKVAGIMEYFHEHGDAQAYLNNMQGEFGSYCDALREWGTQQQILDNFLGESNPFHFDTSRPAFHEAAIKEVIGPAPDAMTVQALSDIEFYNQSYQNFLRLKAASYQQITQLEASERAFNTEIQEAITNLSGRELRGWMVTHHVDVDSYIEKLRDLKNASDQVLVVLDTSVAYLGAGMVQEGINDYINAFDPQAYEDALVALVTPQRVALGRLPDPLSPFMIGVGRIRLHEKFLQQMSTLSVENPVIDRNNIKVIDEAMWTSAITEISGIEENHRSQTADPVIRQHLNTIHRQFRDVADGVGSFLDAFSGNRELFEEMMRAAGYSDLETAYIYNHFDGAYEAFVSWNQRFQAVVDLVNVGEPRKAMDQFAKIIQEGYPGFIQAMQHITLVTDQLSKMGQETSGVLDQFLGALKIDLKKRQMIRPALEHVIGCAPNTLLNFNEAVKMLFSYEKPGAEFPKDWHDFATKEFPQEWIDARGVLTANMVELDLYQSKEVGLYTQSSRFADFFNVADPKWKAILKKQGWTTARIKAYSEVYNELAKEIEPLRKGEIAYFNEQNPEKQRALGAQLRKLAAEKRPQIEHLRLQLNQLGGLKRLMAMQSLVEEHFGVNVEEARDKLETKYLEHPSLYQAFPFYITSADQMMTLEDKFMSLPATERSLLDFSSEINLIQAIKMTEEAQALVGLLEQRNAFLNQIYEDLSLYMPVEYGVIQRSLLTGPHAEDPRWKSTLKARGWDAPKITKFSKLYDTFQRNYEPLYLAERRLSEDPDNVLLQEEFERVREVQTPKLNKFTQELKRMGGIKILDDLGFAVSNYTVILEKYPLSAPQRETSLQMLGQLVDLKEKLTQMSEWIHEMSTFLPLSWDKNHFKPLREVLSVSELKEVQTLYRGYQTLLRKVQKLERKLEADPGNRNLRNALRQEIQTKRARFQELEERYEKLKGEIPGLQAKIDKHYGDMPHIDLEYAFFQISNVYRSASKY